uniref:cell wall integrity and stress response component 2-like isoform X1 n=1 Tax=Gasterosteus aculeatus aculeatus TaxID=481459 RepID=UPI001A9A1E5C|nr:cell wall integrity and stress response component 2-like isoform X1 [Gasterosteus aculeatus aculeatus]
MMRRRTDVGLSAFVLLCHVAAVIPLIVEEKASATLRCPHPVEEKVTWSRELGGSKVDILTPGGDRDIKHVEDPHKRYSSQADKSLHIYKVTTSDSGRYFCNREDAVELTVIPAGAAVREAEEGTRVTLTCPPDGGSPARRWSTTHTGAITDQKGFHVSPADQTLTITSVEMNNSGLYSCDGKPVVYLHVTKAEGKTTTSASTTKRRRHKNKKTTTTSTSRRPETRTSAASTPGGHTETTTTSTSRRPETRTSAASTPGTHTETTTTSTSRRPETRTSAASTPGTHTEKDPHAALVVGIVSPIFIIIIIFVVYFAWRRRLERRGSAEICNVYEEIQEGPAMTPTNGGGRSAGPTASVCMADFTGPSQLPENPYCFLKEPKGPANNTDALFQCSTSIRGV